MVEINADPNGLNLVLLGKTRAGKSSSGNTILGREAFISKRSTKSVMCLIPKKSSRSVTRDLTVESGTVNGFPVTVYDTPGLFNTTMREEEVQQILEKVLQKCESRPCVFLLVIKAKRLKKKERKTVEKIEKLLGENRIKNTWILFTRGDELEEEKMTINEFINETERLKKLVHRYDQRYHVFNNKPKEPSEQVQELLIKILKAFIDTKVNVEMKPNPLRRIIPDAVEPDAPVSSLSSRRIVLLGKSGVGKSAAGNTILGQNEFVSVISMNSVTSESSVKQTTVSGRSVSVVDTPGFIDTKMKPEELAMKIGRSVYESSPGPHAFLIVFKVNDRFTEHEQQIPQMIEMMFGEEVLKYSIILFTHGDLIEGKYVEELINQNTRLRHLVQQCGNRFHVFNNKDQNNRKQVNDLLKKIDSMIEQNGGGHYSNEMLEYAQSLRQEEEERKQREEEERKRQEEKARQELIDRVRRETENKTREECEAKMRSELEKHKKEEERKQQERERTAAEKKGGFGQFMSKYWPFLLGAAIVGCGLGAVIAALAAAVAGAGALAVGAAGVGGAVVGAVVGAGVTGAICFGVGGV